MARTSQIEYREAIFVFSLTFTALVILGFLADIFFRVLLDISLSTPIIILPSLILASIITVWRYKILKLIFITVAKFIEKGDNTPQYSVELEDPNTDIEDYEDSAYTYLVWVLLKDITKTVLKKDYEVILVTADDGYIVGYYPLDILVVAEMDLDEITPSKGKTVEVTINDEDKLVIIVVEEEKLIELIKSAKLDSDEDEGTRLVIKDEYSLKILYEIIREIYLAANPSAPKEIAAYIAYKTMKNLMEKGVIDVPRTLEKMLPFEPPEIRSMVIRQIEEEESLLSKSKSFRQ